MQQYTANLHMGTKAVKTTNEKNVSHITTCTKLFKNNNNSIYANRVDIYLRLQEMKT